MKPPRDPATLPAWQELRTLAETVGQESVAALAQTRTLLVQGGPLTLDYSRQRVNAAVLDALFALAREAGVPEMRDAMFAGEHVNTTEGRAALHTALRSSGEADTGGAAQLARDEFERLAAFADGVRSGVIRGMGGQRFQTVINIGIGGSDLGPRMVYEALFPYRDPQIDVRFVSNIDPDDLHEALIGVNPATTLVIIASKTFTTAETMANATRALDWLREHLGDGAVEKHVVALSTATDRVRAMGITADQTFGFWDWVGGRFSIGSAIGLADMIAIGSTAFREMLDGFAALDGNFRNEPPERNLPMILGLLGIWNRNFLHLPTVAVLPYAHRLRSFPSYLQQLIMESNGKSVRRNGESVTYPTSPVIWGAAGTNGQHSFHQFLHQGTDDVACDILVFGSGREGDAQRTLVAHALAQAEVLALGRSSAAVFDSGVDPSEVNHRVMPGNRPTNVIIARTLDPFTLGALIALYEHAVVVQAAIWGINAFDQWGVELGKVVAGRIEQGLQTGELDALEPITQQTAAAIGALIRD